MKLIIFVLGLAIGLGGGIYWSAKNPAQANAVAAAEEKKFIQLQLQTSQTIKQKLDQLANRQQQQQQQQSSSTDSSGSGTISSRSAPAVTTNDINSVRDQQDKQIQRLQQRLNQLK